MPIAGITKGTNKENQLLIYIAYLILVAAYPIYDGSRTIILYLFLACCISALLLIYLVWSLWRRGQDHSVLSENRPILWLIALGVAIAIFQTLPLFRGEQFVVDSMQEWIPGFVKENRFPLSLDRLETYRWIILHSSHLAFFVLTLVLVNSWRKIWLLVAVMLSIGIFEAIFGLINYLAGEAVFGWAPIHWSFQMATGTYKNKNHFAGLLILAAAVPIGLVLSSCENSKRTNSVWNTIRQATRSIMSFNGIIFVLLIILFSAVELSKSRGVFVASGFSFVVIVIMHRIRRGSIKGLILPGAVLLGSFVVFGGSDLVKRLGALPEHSASRVEQWSLSLSMLREYPILGVGSGAYSTAFPAYKSENLPPLRFDHAHNDYLELLIEQGIPGFIIGSVAICLILMKLTIGYYRSRSRCRQGVLLGVLFGLLAMLLHAAVDYPFQIPANAAWFYVLSGIGLSALRLPATRVNIM